MGKITKRTRILVAACADKENAAAMAPSRRSAGLRGNAGVGVAWFMSEAQSKAGMGASLPQQVAGL